MLGILLLIAFELCGLAIARSLFAGCARAIRAWLGLCLGLVLMMWMPALFAFALRFTPAAQFCGLGVAALVAALCLWRRPNLRDAGSPAPPTRLICALVIPLTLFSAYLQYTHVLCPGADGTLYVGQSTYGDLCLHLGIATGLDGASFPPEYTILPGVMLGYPFLVDALSASMYQLGCNLALSFTLPGTLMMALVYWGFCLFTWEFTRRKGAVLLAFLLLFLGGGLGFLYTFDQVFEDSTLLQQALFGYYYAPANYTQENVRWVNCVVDLLLPQRTLLAGWLTVLPALYLLLRGLKANNRRLFVALGVWAGAMPMIHTHSFLALGAISLGALAYYACRKERDTVANLVLYGAIACVLALPQLLFWSFPQTFGGGYPRLRFNWVNNTGSGLIDEYFWFWIKNVGPVFIVLAPAALSAGRRGKALALGALILFALAELVQFQENSYDNIKLFYVAYIAVLPLAAQYLLAIYDRLKGIRGRALLAAVFLVLTLTSGAMSLAREAISRYALFSPQDVEAAEFVKENTERDAVFLTDTDHINPVSVLAGRTVVCGPDLYLWWHGFAQEFTARSAYIQETYANPSFEALAQYDVDYVYIGATERGYGADVDWFAQNLTLVYDSGGIQIYAVPED